MTPEVDEKRLTFTLHPTDSIRFRWSPFLSFDERLFFAQVKIAKTIRSVVFLEIEKYGKDCSCQKEIPYDI